LRENVRRLRPKHWRQNNWPLNHYHALSHITKKSFIKNNMTVVPHPPYFSLYPQLKTKLKGHHFVTFEVIQAESQAMLNILTEHDFQDAFKNGSDSPGSYGWMFVRLVVAGNRYEESCPFPRRGCGKQGLQESPSVSVRLKHLDSLRSGEFL
jgi:hypothetical protein